MKIESFKYSDSGPRLENQDSISVKEFEDFFVACIADGVGGRNCGSIASQESINFFLSEIINNNVKHNEHLRNISCLSKLLGI